MFELLSTDRRRAPHTGVAPALISTVAHVIVVGALVAVPFFYVRTELPDVPDMMAFVVAAPAPPPPPPPPPPPAPAATRPKSEAVKRVPTPRPQPVPVRAPVAIEEATEFVDIAGEEGVPGGIEGGVPGGVPGGVIGGVVGGMIPTGAVPPPPPPPPPAVERGPVRVGGEITVPALLERVEPEYPPLALRAHVEGLVILEATVDRQGRVEEVRVLRSIPLLDAAAMRAVRQWRYSPLLLNGKPERFVLTVTVSFSVDT